MRFNAAILIAFLSVLANGARAETPDLFIVPERTENCLAVSPDQNDCVGIAAGACSELPTGSTLEGMTTCVVLERSFWQGRMDGAYLELQKNAANSDLANSSAEGFTSLADGLAQMQSGWLAFRNAQCFSENSGIRKSLERQLFETQCLMRMDANQARYLAWLLESDT